MNFKELLEQCEESFEINGEYDAELIFTDDYKLKIISIIGTLIIDMIDEKIELIPR